MEEYGVIGKRLPRVDSIPMATGSALYTGDIKLPGLLHGKILRSPLPHAKILNIDTSKAEKLAGVKAVITAKDTPGKQIGFSGNPEEADQYPLALDKVRYIGDEIAAVAAIDEDIALEALELIRVDYEILPAVFDPEEAMQEGAPQVHEATNNNIATLMNMDFGEPDKALLEADYVREDTFKISPLHQGFMETWVTVAHYEPPGRLTIWTPSQSTFFTRRMLAQGLDLREGDIRVIKPFMGGGHCSKHEALAHHFSAAVLSRKTGRPVRIELDREEVFLINRGAPYSIITLKTGVKKDGSLVAKKCKVIGDNGAYRGLAPAFIYLCGAFLPMPYRLPNMSFEGYLVYTNNPPSATQRGSGVLTIRAAADTQLNIIAADLGIDPAEMRHKNALQTGDTTGMGFKIKSGGLQECITQATTASAWRDKAKTPPQSLGIGIACGGCSSGFKGFIPHDTSAAFVKVHEDGTVDVISGALELGQGINTVLSQIAAEELGVLLEDVKIYTGDTDIGPIDLGSYGSRGTLQAGNAVKKAAADAKNQILEIAAGILGVEVDKLRIKNRKIYLANQPDKYIPISEAVRASQYSEEGKPILGKGFYNPSSDPLDPVTFKGNVSLGWSFVTQIAEVEIDRETGKVKLLRVTAADDCGFPLNPMAVEGQIEGQISQGMGQALMELRLLDNGIMLNPSLLEYKMPTAMDMPDTKIITVKTIDPDGPFGAKECSEGPQVPVVPAIVSAISHATGVCIKEFPVLPEKLLELLKASK
jgi:4-hydroxybenzoyl-CoA reductase subunit alpha